jgi:hypothetical protein
MYVVFLNSIHKQCGVYQYGLRLYNILKKCKDITYKYFEIDNVEEYNSAISQFSPGTCIIYNYHTSTMRWLNRESICRKYINIGMPHESNNDCFDMLIDIDPNGLEKTNVFNIPRPIYENVDELLANYVSSTEEIHNFINYRENDLPIFGSFGFGFQDKGFDKIVDIINKHYDNAIIKFIMPFAHYDLCGTYNYNTVCEKCIKCNIKPGIKLMITTFFCSNEDILYFLKSNSMNIFLYDPMLDRGMSSVLDYALSVNVPFCISDSYTFRHVYSDEVCAYKTELPMCFRTSLKHLKLFQTNNSHMNVINKFKKFLLPKTENVDILNSHCRIIIDDEEILYNKLPEINYLCSQYEVITFNTKCITQISNIFKQANIVYDNISDDYTIIINLSDYSISSELQDKYDFEPLTYLSGGKLGDFIQNLSVINENFYKTGKKGILYVGICGDYFQNGLENTYNEINDAISYQRYIKMFKIHENEYYQIDLNCWRKNPGVHHQNFYHTYAQSFNIEWGKHKWIHIPAIDYSLCDKILINTLPERFKDIDYTKFITEYGNDKLIFVCVDTNQYLDFVNRTNIIIPCLHVTTFTNLCIAINSCKLFIGSPSMPLSVANALFKDSIIITHSVDCKLHDDFDLVFENVKQIL